MTDDRLACSKQTEQREAHYRGEAMETVSAIQTTCKRAVEKLSAEVDEGKLQIRQLLKQKAQTQETIQVAQMLSLLLSHSCSLLLSHSCSLLLTLALSCSLLLSHHIKLSLYLLVPLSLPPCLLLSLTASVSLGAALTGSVSLRNCMLSSPKRLRIV